MAQLDPSIILGAKPMQIESPVNQLAKVLQVQEMQQMGDQRAMQMQDAQRARERQNKLTQMLSGGNVTPETLMRGGFMAEAQAMQEAQGKAAKNTADVGKTTAETEKVRLQAGREKLGFVAQLLSGVKDQATYDQAKALAQQNGLPIDNMPPQYDPTVIEQAKIQALTVQEQIEQIWKQKGYDLDVRKQGETERNNKTQNAISQGNLRVAQGNLSLSGQRLAFDKTKPMTGTGALAKPMPATALRMQQEAVDAIATANSIKADLGAMVNQIDAGALDLGPIANIKNQARNKMGISSEQSRNLQTFEATLEKLRNDSLRLNKGVQTDGDAQRAWNELLKDISDPKAVRQRLMEIQAINERGAELQRMNVETIRNNYNQPELDLSGRTNIKPAIGAVPAANIDALLEKYK
jgi:hypothetical protein